MGYMYKAVSYPFPGWALSPEILESLFQASSSVIEPSRLLKTVDEEVGLVAIAKGHLEIWEQGRQVHLARAGEVSKGHDGRSQEPSWSRGTEGL